MQNSPAAAGFGDVRQLGYVVDDLAAAMSAWSAQVGVGPWSVIRNVRLNAVYRGAPSQPLIDIAMGYFGPLQIELIQQRNDAASPYRAMIQEGRCGLHHIAFLAPQIDADVKRAETQGLRPVCDIRMTMSGRYVYLQAPELGDEVHFEFLDATPMLRHMYRQGMRDAERWDGTRRGMALDLGALPTSLLKAAGNALRPAHRTRQRPVPRLGRVCRIAYVVADIDATATAWQTRLGAGPWRIERDLTLTVGADGTLRPARVDRALARCGDCEIALIRPHNALPSPYRAAFLAQRCNVHHIAFPCTDLDAAACAARARGMRVAYDVRCGNERELHLQSAALGANVVIVLLDNGSRATTHAN